VPRPLAVTARDIPVRRDVPRTPRGRQADWSGRDRGGGVL